MSTFLLAGLGDSADSLIQCSDKLIGLGVYPFVVPFVLISGTPLAQHPAPSTDFMVQVYAAVAAGLRDSDISAESFTPSVRWGIGIDADDFLLSPTASSDRFTFHLLRPNSSLINGYWELRCAIFCEEQHLFEATDRDEIDADAYPITAIHHGSSHCGQVVGVVRIVEQQARI